MREARAKIDHSLSFAHSGLFLLPLGVFLGFFTVFMAQQWYTSSRLQQNTLEGGLIIIVAFLPLLAKTLKLFAGQKGGKVDLFSPDVAFPLFYGIMYGVGFFRSSFLGLGVGEYMGRYIMEGLITFWTGLIIAQFIMPKLLSRKRRRWGHSWDTARLYKILWLTFCGCLFVFLFSLRRTGWLLAQPNLEVTRTQTIDQIGGYAFYVIRSMALVLYLGFIFIFIHKPRRWRTKGMLLAIMIIGSLVLLGTGYRNGVVVAIIGAMAIYNYAVRPIGIKALLLVALALLLGTAGYGLWRAGQPAIFSLFGILDRAWHEIALPLHTMQRIVENVPWLVPHLHGRGVLMTFVALLPGEQPVLGPWLKQQLGLNFAGGGFPPSILGGFFLEFGEAGILAGMFTVGFILQSAYLWMRKHPSDYSLIIYCFLFTYFIQSIRDGFLKDFFPIWFLLMITFLHVVMTRTPTIRFTVKPADQSAR